MTMMTNIIAMLISFAMMLTGAGGEGQGVQARNVVLRNVAITYNDERVELPQALRLGVSTDGEKAVFDFAVDQNGEALLPIQLGVSDAGLTALFTKSDVAAQITAGALNGLMEQAGGAMNLQNLDTQGMDPQSQQILQLITEQFLPAYEGLMAAAQDPDFQARVQQKGDALMAELVDRGEGVAATALIEGEKYDVTEYNYTVNAEQMAALCDALFASEEALSNYADALFKLYAMMPEESGLNGVASFADLFGKTGLQVRMDMTEQVSADGQISFTDGTLTMDMAQMIAATTRNAGDNAQMPEIPPIVFDIQGVKAGEETSANVTCDYQAQGAGVYLSVSSNTTAEMNSVDFTMNLSQQENLTGTMYLNAMQSADGTSAFNLSFSVPGQADVSLLTSGYKQKEGGSRNSVDLFVTRGGNNLAVSFDVDETTDAIEDLANGHEAAVVLDKLDGDTLNRLGQDEATQAALMQVIGSLSADAQKLTGEENLARLTTLGQTALQDAMTAPATAGAALEDYAYDMDDMDLEGDYEEIEDDGVLAFKTPEFTWMPEGWSVTEVNEDTAYDWVDMTLTDGTGAQSAYAVFFQDSEENQATYVVGEDGSISRVEGRQVTVSEYGEGSLSATLHENGVYCNIMFDGKDIDIDTVGKVVAGMAF